MGNYSFTKQKSTRRHYDVFIFMPWAFQKSNLKVKLAAYKINKKEYSGDSDFLPASHSILDMLCISSPELCSRSSANAC